MRIPLDVYFFAEGLRAMAHFLLRSENPHIFLPIRSIVDTGSPITILGIPDLKRARVSQLRLRDLESRKKPINYGGGKVNTKVLRNAKLKFGDFLECEMPIQIPVDEIKEGFQPTILGVDFLEENNLKFVFDPNKREAYFEKED